MPFIGYVVLALFVLVMLACASAFFFQEENERINAIAREELETTVQMA